MVREELSRGRRLDDLISRLQSGEVTIEDILRDEELTVYDLGPLLTTAAEVREAVQPPQPRAGFLRNSEIRILNKLRFQTRHDEPTQASQAPPRGWFRRLAPALAGVFLALSLTMGMLGVGRASAASLPGDTLYGVKRGIEKIRLTLTFDEVHTTELMQAFLQERLAEIEALARLGRLEDLTRATETYIEDVDRLMQSTSDAESFGSSGDPILEENLAHNVEVLQNVQGKVPPQAQAAIQRAIDRSIEHTQEKQERKQQKEQEREVKQEEQEQKREEKQGDPQGEGASNADPRSNQDQHQAEQISRKYNVSLEEVMSTYEGACAENWNCVRAHFREQNRRGD